MSERRCVINDTITRAAEATTRGGNPAESGDGARFRARKLTRSLNAALAACQPWSFRVPAI